MNNATDETAFPLQPGQVVLDHQGMSLRDWFAGQALVGMMSIENVYVNNVEAEVARMAYRQADAMMEARKQFG